MPRYSTKRNSAPTAGPGPLPLILALAGLALILLAGWALWSSRSAETSASPQVKGAPRLKVDRDSIDHGKVKLGTPITDEVRVTNVGDQPLRFSRAPYLQVLEGC
jgi:hypothetical protein